MRCGRRPLLQFGAAWFAAVSVINHSLARPATMNQPVSTEVSAVQRNARDWRRLAEHGNGALADSDGYAVGDGSEVQDFDEAQGGQLAMGNGTQIAIVRPRNFRDAATVGDYFRQEIPVIINLEDLDNAIATRIIDFVSGLILGLRGDIERISRRTFLIVPADAAILTAHVGLTEEGFFNQALRPANDGRVFSAGRRGRARPSGRNEVPMACRPRASRPALPGSPPGAGLDEGLFCRYAAGHRHWPTCNLN